MKGIHTPDLIYVISYVIYTEEILQIIFSSQLYSTKVIYQKGQLRSIRDFITF